VPENARGRLRFGHAPSSPSPKHPMPIRTQLQQRRTPQNALPAVPDSAVLGSRSGTTTKHQIPRRSSRPPYCCPARHGRRLAGRAMLTGIAHIALTVRDLPTSVDWYRDVLKLPLIAEFAEDGQMRRKAVLGNETIRLGLVRILRPPTGRSMRPVSVWTTSPSPSRPGISSTALLDSIDLGYRIRRSHRQPCNPT
jgi:Glyoxalase/Bleomycin resistance protein/Dioxygenase superfamily